MDKKRNLALKITGVFLLVGLGLIVWVVITFIKISKELPNPEQFAVKQITQSTKIYDKTGKVLLYEIHGEEKRTVVPFDQIPDYVKQATLSAEDQSFYQHAAFDWRALIRAGITDLISGKLAQGGSTITQQLAKITFLSPEKTFSRKIKELILSYWIEKHYSKDEILNLYLNQISYGANAYGIEAAAQTYFSKSAKDLTLAEASVLAAMPKAPSYYSPWGPHQDELASRKNYILDQMSKLGFIDQEEKNRAQNTKLKFANQSIGTIKAPHFTMMVRDYLSSRYGDDVLEKGGLKVITTLDWSLQELAESIIKEGADRNTQLYQGKNAALVAEDPKTGQILALVGSKDYFDIENGGNFNVATQGLRQPGSSFKPFVYITAFEKGYSPDTVVFDLPTEFSSNNNNCPVVNINFYNNDPQCFHPENFDKNFRGPVNLRNALAQSINVPSVKVLYLAGLVDTIKTAQALGITTIDDPNRYGLSLVLGGGEVKLIDMVGAYSVFAQEGIKHQQSLVLEVQDSQGRTLEKYLDISTPVIDAQYPRLINNILSDSSARAPLFQNSFNLTVFPGHEVALKTGTTNDYKDAWTIGYTPSLVVGVWAGNNNNKPMQKQAGSILAAIPIWSAFINKALEGQPLDPFNRPGPTPETNKPMLSGNYLSANNEIHNILYYVNKNDPLGPIPENPQNDSQFLNWEKPLQEWLGKQPKEFLTSLIKEAADKSASSTTPTTNQ
jgi:1A family penicillin-binding protein